MAGGTKIRRNDSYRSDDESATRSRASVKKKTKKSSEVSTAASTSSNVRKKAKNQKAADVVDNLMTAESESPSRSKGEKKRKVPKKIKRKKNIDDGHIDTDDVISCLTDNSDLKKVKKTKKRSSSKKSRKSKSSTDGNLSDGTDNTSSSKKNKKKDLSKLNRRDKFYHQNSEKISVASPYYTQSFDEDDDNQKKKRLSSRRSRASSRSSSTKSSRSLSRHSRSSAVSSSRKSSRSPSRHSRTSAVSSRKSSRSPSRRSRTSGVSLSSRKSSRSPSHRSRISAVSSSKKKKKKKKVIKNSRDGSTKQSVPKRSQSTGRRYDNSGSDFDDISISDSDEEQAPSFSRNPREKVSNRPGLSRMNSVEQVRQMGLVSNRRNPPPVRIAARGDSVEVRSRSADDLREMRMNLARNPSNRSVQKTRNTGNANGYSNTGGRVYCAPSPRDAPLRRGVARNSSAPLRPGRGPGGGPHQQRGPLRSGQRRPPQRTSSGQMTTSQHVEMLEDLRMGRRNNNNNYQRQRSSSQPPGGPLGGSRHNRPARQPSRIKSPNNSLSPSRDALRTSSHHNKRIGFRDNSYPSKGDISNGDIMDSSDIDSSEGSVEIKFERDEQNEELNDSRHSFGINGRNLPRTRSGRSGLTRSNSNDSFLKGLSAHSFKSNRSQMSIDSKEGFDDDPNWKKALRYIRLLAPHKGETKLKKKIRLFTWTSIVLDFIAAMVAAVQYDGSTECCKEPIFNALLKLNWDVLFRVVTALYLILIIAEIVPVIKNGIPFNIVNPTIGFIITFGMFFDDSVFEAVSMWVIEVLAIFFEFLVYRVNARIYFETTFKLKQVDEELEALKAKRKQIAEMVQDMNNSAHSFNGSAHAFNGSAHGLRNGYLSRDNSRNYQLNDLEMGGRTPPAIGGSPYYDDDDNDSFSGNSFGEDEDFYDEKTPSGRSLGNGSPAKSTPPPIRRVRSKAALSNFSQHGSRPPNRVGLKRAMSRDTLGASTHTYEASTVVTGPGGRIRLPGEIKQNRLLRQRRILRQNKQSEAMDLHYHFIGTILNVSIAVMAMILVVTIASTGGLCFKDNSVSVFSFDQLGKCDECSDKSEYCEVCTNDGNQCYFPYY